MKYLKMLGLAVVTAIAMTAILGAGSASATVLCHETTSPCPQKWGNGTQIEFSLKSGTSALWRETSGATVKTCTGGTIKGEITNAGSETEAVKISVSAAGFSWTGCTVTTETLKGGEIELAHITGTDNATVTFKGFEFTTTQNGITCKYGVGEGIDVGILTGSATGDSVMDINSVLPVTGGGLCCADVTWVEEFTLTKPQETPLYVRKS